MTTLWFGKVRFQRRRRRHFGPASGVYRYLASEVQSWKNAGDTANVDIQLSAGAGTKTVYAKFMDLSGNIVGTSSFEVTLTKPIRCHRRTNRLDRRLSQFFASESQLECELRRSWRDRL